MATIKRIESDYPGNVEVFWHNGSSVGVRDYDPVEIDGVEELAHGETFTYADGCTVTRVGDKALWWTPGHAA